MADFYIDPSQAVNGTGTELDPFNTFVGITWASNNRYFLKRGTVLRETILPTGTANNITLAPYGPDLGMPIVDCENTRATGLNLNTKNQWTITGIWFKNQNAAVPDGAIRVSGARHRIYNNKFSNCQSSIHINASASNYIFANEIDCGNPLTPAIAYGIRINAVGSIGNIISRNRIYSTATMTFINTIQIFSGGAGNILAGNVITCPKGDGPTIRSNTSGCYMIANVIYGPKTLDALVVEGSNNNFIWNNVAVNTGDIPTHFGPAFKMGDEFGAGSPADFNDISNNIFVSLGANNCMNLTTIGVNNTFNNNVYWKPSATISSGAIVNLNTGGSTVGYNYTNWMGLGYDTLSQFLNPNLSDKGVAPYNPNIYGAGVFRDYLQDALGRQFYNPPSIGAYEYERPRIARS